MAKNEDFKTKVYKMKDAPKKRKYFLERMLEIYDGKKKSELEKILDSVEIIFREQDERGASNHKNKKVYITTREFDRYNIIDVETAKEYLENPKSVITHEVAHIFQNIYKDFPHVDYTKDDNSVDYEKYVTDQGEIQARIEQIIDMLDKGFTKSEVSNFLYSKKYKDKELWKMLVNDAEKIMNKED